MDMETIAKAEWTKTHKDYRSVINGQRYIMRFEGGKGTCLVPVKVEGLKDLPTRAQGVRDIVADGKAGIIDEKRISPETAALILRMLEKEDEGDIISKMFDWRGFVSDVERMAQATLEPSHSKTF
jgi:hypothetical protein